MKKELKNINIEEELFYQEDSHQHPPEDLIAYNELRSCADLFRMYKQEILEIQPDFQREEVWDRSSQTRFIDSLIKQLPIPSMCFSVDYKTQKWQVIDGLQRMTAIIKFLSDKDWCLSNLPDVDPVISGKKVETFMDTSSDLHPLLLRVENLTLPITVLRCDYSKKSHTNYLFTIFHRLNTGGVKLNNQEIRNCIYSGRFNQKLKAMNQYHAWTAINKIKTGESLRFRTIEIILRFLAFYETYNNYNGRLARFLNEYMDKNRDLNESLLNEKENIFKQTVDIIYSKGSDFFKLKRSNAVLESIMFGVALNIDKLNSISKESFGKLIEELLQHEALSADVLKYDVVSKEKVLDRLNAAKEIFSRG